MKRKRNFLLFKLLFICMRYSKKTIIIDMKNVSDITKFVQVCDWLYD